MIPLALNAVSKRSIVSTAAYLLGFALNPSAPLALVAISSAMHVGSSNLAVFIMVASFTKNQPFRKYRRLLQRLRDEFFDRFIDVLNVLGSAFDRVALVHVAT